MLRLRPYKQNDSKTIAEWLKEEDVFLKWGGKLFGDFPISAEIIDEKYRNKNGGCEESDNFYPWVAIDEENNVVGHFIMRYLHGDNRIIRFGWVIVDDKKRGKGYGKQMLQSGLKYAFEIMDAKEINLGVFVNNEPAHHCYKAAGFRDSEIREGNPWQVMEMVMHREDYISSKESM